jgi:hypothetical protein
MNYEEAKVFSAGFAFGVMFVLGLWWAMGDPIR